MSAFDKCPKDWLVLGESAVCTKTNILDRTDILKMIDENILSVLRYTRESDVSEKHDTLSLLWKMREKYIKEIEEIAENELFRKDSET